MRDRGPAVHEGRVTVTSDDERGDTLIELLFALVILGMCGIALLISFSTALSFSVKHRSLTSGNLAIQSVSEAAFAQVQQSAVKLFDSNCVGAGYYGDHLLTGNWRAPTLQGLPNAANYSLPAGFHETVVSISYWNSTSNSWSAAFAPDVAPGAACTANPNNPQLLRLEVISGDGATYPFDLVVVNPAYKPPTAPQFLTLTTLSVSANPAIVNQNIVLTATVTILYPGYGNFNPSDTVTFYNGITPITCSTGSAPFSSVSGTGTATQSCVTSFSTTTGSPFQLSAQFNGESAFQGSGSSAITEVVQKAANSITVLSSAPGSAVVGGATYNVSASALSGDAITIASSTTSYCTVGSVNTAGGTTSATVSFVGAGTCTLTFDDPGNAAYLAAAQKTQTFTVGKGANTITVQTAAPGSAVVGGSTYTVKASATSGDNITMASSTTTVCTVGSVTSSGGVTSGTVTFVGAGTCTLTFNDAGNVNYVAAAQQTQSFVVAKGANVISITSTAPAAAQVGAASGGVKASTYTAKASATSGDAISIATTTPSICTVGAATTTAGVTSAPVSTIAVGTCTLTFNDAGNANYVAATQQNQSFNVAAGTPYYAVTVVSGKAGSVSITATVTDGYGNVVTTGSVAFYSGGTPIAGCTSVPIVGGLATCTPNPQSQFVKGTTYSITAELLVSSNTNFLAQMSSITTFKAN